MHQGVLLAQALDRMQAEELLIALGEAEIPAILEASDEMEGFGGCNIMVESVDLGLAQQVMQEEPRLKHRLLRWWSTR
jgi:hypothetical protein